MENSQEVTSGQTNRASRSSHGRQLQLGHRLSIIILAALGAVFGPFLGMALASQPEVTAPTAQQFFSTYYSHVTQPGDRKLLYRKDIAPGYNRSIHSDWRKYNEWWSTWKQVDIEQVKSAAGNPMEFNIWLRYYPVHGQPLSEEDGFTLACRGFWASLEARIPALGCPVNQIQFQSQLFINVIN